MLGSMESLRAKAAHKHKTSAPTRRNWARRWFAIEVSRHDTVRLRLNGFGPPFLDRFAAVSDRFSGSWCRFLESLGPDGENGEKTGENGGKMGEKWPKESGSND